MINDSFHSSPAPSLKNDEMSGEEISPDDDSRQG